jgi:hypothetical protein
MAGLRGRVLAGLKAPEGPYLGPSLANLVKRSLGELIALAKARLRRMQYRPGLLEAILARTRLDLAPLCNPRK